MLNGAHPDPRNAARELLDRFAPVVSIETARQGENGHRPIAPERWTIGLILARWLVRMGWQAEDDAKQPSAKASELRERLYRSLSDVETERMVAIFCDARGRILSQELVAEGDTGQLRLSLRQLFSKALRRNARRMIIAHNHPSGCAAPSEVDIISTRRLSDYASSLGIVLEDHLIIGHESIVSMRSLQLF